MTHFNLQECFIIMLRDKHRDLFTRLQDIRKESRLLQQDIQDFEYMFKEIKKILGKESKEKLSGLWSFENDKDHYQRLQELKVTHNGEEVPFFSEIYLYQTIGKENARTVLALLNKIYSDAGKAGDF